MFKRINPIGISFKAIRLISRRLVVPPRRRNLFLQYAFNNTPVFYQLPGRVFSSISENTFHEIADNTLDEVLDVLAPIEDSLDDVDIVYSVRLNTLIFFRFITAQYIK